jgi:hypothetical protein
VRIDAYVANWDQDVEVDGLVVHVFPLDCDGLVTPVDGTLNVTLVGQQLGAVRDREPFPHLGQWTRAVCLEDFGPAGAVYRLPFQAVHPEFDLRVSSGALAHARLIVPGSGTFEDSQATLRIRPYSAFRDHLQQRRGTRFLPVERTGRGG